MADDYYQILGVARDASAQDIKKAFRQVARECHPDVAGDDPVAEARFKAARKAYETLSDPLTRGRYDRRNERRAAPKGSFFDAFYRSTGRRGADASTGGRGPGGGAGPGGGSGPSAGAHDAGGHASTRNARRNPKNDLDLEDLFSDVADYGFGGGRGGAGPGGHDARDGVGAPGADVHVHVEVPESVARRGGSVSATYHRMQRVDSWRPGEPDPGLVRVQDVADIRVLPGSRTGQVLREKGLGDAGPYGGAYGDLLVELRVVADPRPQAPPPPEPSAAREPRASTAEAGAEELDIGVVEAILGGRVEVQVGGATVRLTIPPGTSSGTKLRLKGRGPGGADLFLRVRIVVPRDLDEESRALIERFAALNPGA